MRARELSETIVNSVQKQDFEYLEIPTKFIHVIYEFDRYLMWKPHLRKSKKYSLLHQFRFSYAFKIFWHEADYSEYLFSGRKSDLVVTGTLIDLNLLRPQYDQFQENFISKFFICFTMLGF